ncbi:hypothetical protein [Megasphaera elsdenii]|uniref:hypothetical protein n=1 Tax=Megasphaera elsdenii TaxID=907 RepID=UPI003FEFCA90
MYHKMCIGMNGFTITTDDDTDVDLRHRYDQMKDRSLGPRRFPAGTDGRSQYEFTLECGYKPVMSFSWDDYPGGYLDVKGTGDMDSYKQIEQSILNSSCLFICIDGTLLQGDDIDEKISAIQDDCSIYINPFFSKYMKEHGALPPTAFVITKWDICAPDNSSDDLKKIISEAFSPFFEAGKTGKTIAAIIPVSIDLYSNSTEPGKRMRPYRIQFPIFMGIFFALRNKINNDKRNKTSLQNQISNERSTFRSFLFGDSDSVKQMNTDVRAIQNKLNINQQNLQKIFSQLEADVPLFFINGKQGKFSDIVEKRDAND